MVKSASNWEFAKLIETKTVLVIDDFGGRHFSAYELQNEPYVDSWRIAYAYGDANSNWTSDSFGVDGRLPSLDVYNGFPHIVSQNVQNGISNPAGLRRTTQLSPGVWSQVVVEASADPSSISLAMDSAGFSGPMAYQLLEFRRVDPVSTPGRHVELRRCIG